MRCIPQKSSSQNKNRSGVLQKLHIFMASVVAATEWGRGAEQLACRHDGFTTWLHMHIFFQSFI